MYEDYDIVKFLFGENPELINQKDNKGWTGFFYACEVKNSRLSWRLIDMYP